MTNPRTGKLTQATVHPRLEGEHIVLPGIASVHSHAFQRALRGVGQGRLSSGPASGLGASVASFWSWRRAMYALASTVDPDAMMAIAEFAYAELARLGVTAVGEFHYVQHAPDGQPYEDRCVMARAVIEAARRVGLRICFQRVLYERPGFGRSVEGAQRRFVDTPEDALTDLDRLRADYAEDPCVTFAVAPHSVRAVRRGTLALVRDYAEKHRLPIHMHVAEQPREVQECLAEYGCRPFELLAEEGLLGPRFVAVHATHPSPSECRLLGDSFVALCRTTERDLGDGAPPLKTMLQHRARLCVGVDSHCLSDPFEELRACELDERTRLGQRQVALDGAALLEAACRHGYAALGMAGAEDADTVALNVRDASLRGNPGAELSDRIVFGASGRAVAFVAIDGQRVDEPRLSLDSRGDRFEEAITKLLSDAGS